MKVALDPSFVALQKRSTPGQSSASPGAGGDTAGTGVAGAENLKPTVQISSQGLALSAQSSPGIDTSGLPAPIADIANRMANNPDPGDMGIVDLYANQPEQQLVNITDPNNITYTGNGELVSTASTQAFDQHAASILPQKQAILKQGLANGDSAAQIFVSLTKFIASQPQSYLQEMDWYGK